jgi:hypothetical protein
MAENERKIEQQHREAAKTAPERKQQPGAQGEDPRKAIDEHGNLDRQKLEQNQERLDVGKDHKTDDMKKGDRGTFP